MKKSVSIAKSIGMFLWRLVCGVALAVVAYHLIVSSSGIEAGVERRSVDYTNIVVILLTTITVLFTIITVAGGIFAFLGFQNLKTKAREDLESVVETRINEVFKDSGDVVRKLDNYLSENESLQNTVREAVVEVVRLELDRLNTRIRDDEGDVS